MKIARLSIFALVATAALRLPLFAGPEMKVAYPANPGWDRMKSLVGQWEGKQPDGKKVTITYQLVSSDTALMETISSMHETDMVTMYHPDGKRLLMTHYCSMGNQPRMRANAPEGADRIVFDYIDGTNVGDMHMNKLVLSFTDATHLKQEWTSRMGGKDETMVFELARKKA